MKRRGLLFLVAGIVFFCFVMGLFPAELKSTQNTPLSTSRLQVTVLGVVGIIGGFLFVLWLLDKIVSVPEQQQFEELESWATQEKINRLEKENAALRHKQGPITLSNQSGTSKTTLRRER